MYEGFRRLGAPYGLTFSDRIRVSNSHLALLAGEFAKEQGQYELFHDMVFKCYFEENRDIGSLAVILQIAVDAGLEGHKLEAALKEERYEKQLAQISKEAQRQHISSVPTFIINGQERIVGAQPLSVFRNMLTALASEG